MDTPTWTCNTLQAQPWKYLHVHLHTCMHVMWKYEHAFTNVYHRFVFKAHDIESFISDPATLSLIKLDITVKSPMAWLAMEANIIECWMPKNTSDTWELCYPSHPNFYLVSWQPTPTANGLLKISQGNKIWTCHSDVMAIHTLIINVSFYFEINQLHGKN